VEDKYFVMEMRTLGTLMGSCSKVLARRSGFRDSSSQHVFCFIIFLSSVMLDWLRLSYLALSIHLQYCIRL
jgi:hypothetical protein